MPDEVTALAEVRLWGGPVGAVAELEGGRIVFEFDERFPPRALEISPVHLPISRRGPIAFDELRRLPAFDGLPGVLADALPDAFGNQVIRAWFAARGEEQRALSPVQRLLYVGERALGALTFHPAAAIPRRPAEQESLDVAALVRDARRILAGEAEVAVPEIYRIGSSAGGMRPKAVVLWNPAARTIRSAFALPEPGDVPCLLKFDGVGTDATSEKLGEPRPWNRVEAAYSRMARAAGIDASHIDLLESADGHAHLLIRRFDVEGDVRLHQHTLGGLLHVDYNDPGASSYEEYLRAILRLGMAQAAVEQGYRRMAFNVMAVNQDDHVKNLSFHLRPDGRWSLAPAYDITFAMGGQWTAQHQMRVGDRRAGITRADLLGVAHTFAIRSPDRILDEVDAAVAEWPAAARATTVPAGDVARITAVLDARRRELGR
jgi:serine/threonine-protein kinase HipA